MARRFLNGADFRGPLFAAGSAGTAGQVLQSAGAGAPPTWGTGSGSTSASDLTSGTLADARLTTRARATANLFLWSSFR